MHVDPRTVVSASTRPATPEQQKHQDDEALKKACQEFEAIFLQTMFKAMRKTVPDGGIFERGTSQEIYQDMLDSELAEKMSQHQSVGIAKQMYEQMAKLLPK